MGRTHKSGYVVPCIPLQNLTPVFKSDSRMIFSVDDFEVLSFFFFFWLCCWHSFWKSFSQRVWGLSWPNWAGAGSICSTATVWATACTASCSSTGVFAVESAPSQAHLQGAPVLQPWLFPRRQAPGLPGSLSLRQRSLCGQQAGSGDSRHDSHGPSRTIALENSIRPPGASGVSRPPSPPWCSHLVAAFLKNIVSSSTGPTSRLFFSQLFLPGSGAAFLARQGMGAGKGGVVTTEAWRLFCNSSYVTLINTKLPPWITKWPKQKIMSMF